MVTLLVRLKLTLLRNSMRRSVWRTVGVIFGMLYALALALAILAGMWATESRVAWRKRECRSSMCIIATRRMARGIRMADISRR